MCHVEFFFFFFQAEDGIRDLTVTGVQTCALPICVQTAWGGRTGVDSAGRAACAPGPQGPFAALHMNTYTTPRPSGPRTPLFLSFADRVGAFLSRWSHAEAAGGIVLLLAAAAALLWANSGWARSEHTSELQSQSNLVCRLLLEKKKKLPSCNN